jgi:hypothetical protein
MQIGEINNSQTVMMTDDMQTMAQDFHVAETNETMIKEQSSDFSFELGSMKIQMHKEDRMEFKTSDKDSEANMESDEKSGTMEMMMADQQRIATMSSAKQKTEALFHPQPTAHVIDMMA